MVWMMAAALAAEIPPLVEAAPAEPVPGATLTWTAEGCALKLRATNTGTAPIVIDWTQSTLTEAGAPSVGLVPGTSSAYSVQVSIPPTVAPLRGYAEVYLFRRDRLPTEHPGACTYVVPSDLDLSIKVGEVWGVQHLTIREDPRAAAAAKAAAEAAAAAAKTLACADARKARVRSKTWALVTGIAGASIGGVAIVAGAVDKDREKGNGNIGGGMVLVIGGGTAATLFGVDSAKHARTLDRLGCSW